MEKRTADLKTRRRWWGALLQRCPRCCHGRVFRGRIAMNEVCPTCGLKFEREEGYFMGALYISYAVSGLVLGLLMLGWHLLLPSLDLGWALLLAVPVYLPLMPAVFRYSRVLWMYFDHWAWPDGSARSRA